MGDKPLTLGEIRALTEGLPDETPVIMFADGHAWWAGMADVGRHKLGPASRWDSQKEQPTTLALAIDQS